MFIYPEKDSLCCRGLMKTSYLQRVNISGCKKEKKKNRLPMFFRVYLERIKRFS